MVKSKLVFRNPVVPIQNPETELILDGEDDNVSLLQEKEVDNLGGKSAYRHFFMPAIEHHLYPITCVLANLDFLKCLSSVIILVDVRQ